MHQGHTKTPAGSGQRPILSSILSLTIANKLALGSLQTGERTVSLPREGVCSNMRLHRYTHTLVSPFEFGCLIRISFTFGKYLAYTVDMCN